jgi:hypothetical protein
LGRFAAVECALQPGGVTGQTVREGAQEQAELLARRDELQLRRRLGRRRRGGLERAAEELRQPREVGGKLKARLPVALGIGVLASGGIRAALRLLMRRARTGKTSSRARPARRRGGGRARSR